MVQTCQSPASTSLAQPHPDFNEFQGIIVVGGDGSLQQAVSALLNRNDAETVRQRPIGYIPAGTANTFANHQADTKDHSRTK